MKISPAAKRKIASMKAGDRFLLERIGDELEIMSQEELYTAALGTESTGSYYILACEVFHGGVESAIVHLCVGHQFSWNTDEEARVMDAISRLQLRKLGLQLEHIGERK